jgi:holo-[acyl-carrier protein] synthase
MRLRAEFQAGRDQDAVHLDAGGADKFELDGGAFAGVEAARQDTPSTGHHGSGEEAHGARRIVGTDGREAEVPSVACPGLLDIFMHTGSIGKGGPIHQSRFLPHGSNARLLCYCGVMLVGTGVDLIEVPRIARSLERFGERFMKRVFTDEEIAYCRARAMAAESFAARFAAKEAGAKALGTGIQHGVTWKELEVRREPGQRPTLHFSGRARAIAGQLGVTNVSLSLTHTATLAMATVHLED